MQDVRKGRPDFLISAIEADRPWSDWLAWELKEAKYIVKQGDFPAGSNVVLKSNQALEKAGRVIIVLTPAAVREFKKGAAGQAFSTGSVWAAALQQGKVLPVRVNVCTLPALFAPLKYIDLARLDEMTAREKLLAEVNPDEKLKTKPIFPGAVADTATAVSQPGFPGPGYRPPLWNVPDYKYNHFFTDRSHTLERLHEDLLDGEAGSPRVRVINGLSGIGKTQVALAYAHRYSASYEAVLWIDARNHDTFSDGLAVLAELLHLPKTARRSEQQMRAGVKNWLSQHKRWLLIIDDIRDPATVQEFTATALNGHVLLTARMQALEKMAVPLNLEALEPQDGARFLLQRAGVIKKGATLEAAPPMIRARALELSTIVGNFPLMLDQIGDFINDTGNNNLSAYIDKFKNSNERPGLLRWRGEIASDHPEPVATTWAEALAEVRKENPAAYELLLLCAFLHCDAIPEEIIARAAARDRPLFGQWAGAPLQMDKAIATLRKYSLLRRDAATQTLFVQRLLQIVLRDGMNEATQRLWAERAVLAVHDAFCAAHASGAEGADGNSHAGQSCRRYFSHVQACAHHIEACGIASSEAAQLLHRMGHHLQAYVLQAHQDTALMPELLAWQRQLEMETAHIAATLERYATLLRRMEQNEEAGELIALAGVIRDLSGPQSQAS